ncbi:MAG: TRAM domain-containing protein [Polyangiales bacterium]
MILELDIDSLAAGGDGIGRDASGRVTFVPRTAPGDRVRARIIKQTKTFARAELVEIVTPSPSRVEPPCPHFLEGCGGCDWMHVARPAQLAAKEAIVAGALRKLDGLTIHPIADPAPPLGWRRRARFHVGGDAVGLYQLGTNRIVPIASCPQLEPGLDAAYQRTVGLTPPSGELALLAGHAGDISLATTRPWRLALGLVESDWLSGVVSAGVSVGEPVIEVEPGLWGTPWDFAQASATGNAELIARMRQAVGPGPGRLLELYAGNGNLTRSLIADGWSVMATDGVLPSKLPTPDYLSGEVSEALEKLRGPYDVVVLDPPRAGAAAAIAGIVRMSPRVIVYVSCDPATLARDATKLVEAGYRATDAWPVDLMPQTSHVEVILRLERS